MRPAVLIHNPRAGRASSAARTGRLAGILRSGGWDAEPRATSGPGDATRLARQAAAGGAAAIFVLGGDGTLREAAAGVLGGDTPLGFLPGGTANVMRYELGLPRRAADAARAMAGATPHAWDVGLCAGQPFLMQASAGLDAEILAAMSPRAKRLLGTAAVAWPALVGFLRHAPPAIELLADDRPLAGSLVIAANIPRYGGPWRILPGARSDDRRLDLLLFRGRSRTATLAFARDLFLAGGRHLERTDVSTRGVERVELLGPADLRIQVDGDVLEQRPPLVIELAAGRVRLLGAATLPGR